MSCLTGHDISEACNLAQQSGDHRLALLLAQAAGNFIPRQMISRQLSEWGDHGVGILYCNSSWHFVKINYLNEPSQSVLNSCILYDSSSNTRDVVKFLFTAYFLSYILCKLCSIDRIKSSIFSGHCQRQYSSDTQSACTTVSTNCVIFVHIPETICIMITYIIVPLIAA